jgi:hypothetical protein
MSVLCSMVGASFTVTAVALVGRTQRTVTAVGNAQISTAQSKFGGASALFDGTGDYLLSPMGSEWDFGTGSFTIEYWIRFNAINTLYVPICLRTGGGAISNGEWWCEITAAENKMYWGFKNQAGTQFYVNLALAGTAFATGQFYHIALVNNAGTAQMYVNGTATGATTALSGSFGGNGTDLNIGAYQGAYGVNGYMDEVRISNTARYTANFTPSTTAFVNAANTLLLIHADGTNASTIFTDDASPIITPAAASVNEGSSLTFNVTTVGATDQTLFYTVTNAGDFATSSGSFSLTSNAGSFSVTPTADATTEGAETFTASVRTGSTSGTIIATSSAVTINDTSVARSAVSVTANGNAKISTAQSQFGGASGLFDGNADYLEITTNLTALSFGTGDFTFEGWFRFANTNTDMALYTGATSNGDLDIRRTDDNTVRIGRVNTAWDLISGASGITSNTWHHIAIVRQSTTLTIYVDGASKGSTSNSINYTVASQIRIGSFGSGGGLSYSGYMDEMRVSNTARYTTTFTPSTSAFSNDANTLLLLHMDGTNNSTTFTDSIT